MRRDVHAGGDFSASGRVGHGMGTGWGWPGLGGAEKVAGKIGGRPERKRGCWEVISDGKQDDMERNYGFSTGFLVQQLPGSNERHSPCLRVMREVMGELLMLGLQFYDGGWDEHGGCMGARRTITRRIRVRLRCKWACGTPSR
jgi:hypothetical protein